MAKSLTLKCEAHSFACADNNGCSSSWVLFYSSAECHVGADLVLWDAEQLLKNLSATFSFFFFLWQWERQPRISLALPLVEVKTPPLLTSWRWLVGTATTVPEEQDAWKQKSILQSWPKETSWSFCTCIFVSYSFCSAELCGHFCMFNSYMFWSVSIEFENWHYFLY